MHGFFLERPGGRVVSSDNVLQKLEVALQFDEDWFAREDVLMGEEDVPSAQATRPVNKRWPCTLTKESVLRVSFFLT